MNTDNKFLEKCAEAQGYRILKHRNKKIQLLTPWGDSHFMGTYSQLEDWLFDLGKQKNTFFWLAATLLPLCVVCFTMTFFFQEKPVPHFWLGVLGLADFIAGCYFTIRYFKA